MFKISFFHMNTHTETFALLINCFIEDTVLKTIPDINQAPHQFIDIINLVDLLLHSPHILQSSRFKFVLLHGWPKV